MDQHDPVNFQLTLAQAAYVINLLADRPFREVSELIPRMVQQVQAAVQAASPAPPAQT